MKYKSQFHSNGLDYVIESSDGYIPTEGDFLNIQEIFKDKLVYEFVTKWVMDEYKISSIEELSRDFLDKCSERWMEHEALRFFIREISTNNIAGIIGLTVKSGELWYYKSSKYPGFMRSALEIVLPFLRNERVEKIIANVDKNNTKSKNLLNDLGFHLTKVDESDEYYALTFGTPENAFALT